MKRRAGSSPTREDWALAAKFDPTIAAMIKRQLPLNLTTYVDVNWPGRSLQLQPFLLEEIAELPPFLRSAASAQFGEQPKQLERKPDDFDPHNPEHFNALIDEIMRGASTATDLEPPTSTEDDASESAPLREITKGNTMPANCDWQRVRSALVVEGRTHEEADRLISAAKRKDGNGPLPKGYNELVRRLKRSAVRLQKEQQQKADGVGEEDEARAAQLLHLQYQRNPKTSLGMNLRGNTTPVSALPNRNTLWHRVRSFAANKFWPGAGSTDDGKNEPGTKNTTAQRIVILVGGAALLLMATYPPWTGRYGNTEGLIGYHFLFQPPAPNGEYLFGVLGIPQQLLVEKLRTQYGFAEVNAASARMTVQVDYVRLLTHGIVVILATVGLYWVCRETSPVGTGRPADHQEVSAVGPSGSPEPMLMRNHTARRKQVVSLVEILDGPLELATDMLGGNSQKKETTCRLFDLCEGDPGTMAVIQKHGANRRVLERVFRLLLRNGAGHYVACSVLLHPHLLSDLLSFHLSKDRRTRSEVEVVGELTQKVKELDA